MTFMSDELAKVHKAYYLGRAINYLKPHCLGLVLT